MNLFAEFLQEKQYLTGVSKNTLDYLGYCWKAWRRTVGDSEPSRGTLDAFVIGIRQSGLSVGATNAYIRGLNSYFSWLFENGHTTEHFKLRALKAEQKVMKTFTDEQLRAIVSWRPRTFAEARLHTLLCLLIDTGIRIDEALSVEIGKLDFHNLLLTVKGKGNKQRVVPLSFEVRKILWSYCQRKRATVANPQGFLFCTSHGGKLSYDNTRRDFQRLLKRLAIEGIDGSFHAFRRKFARSYVKNGGNLFYLMKALGHTSLVMSKRYCEVSEQDLADAHIRTSLLSRLK